MIKLFYANLMFGLSAYSLHFASFCIRSVSRSALAEFRINLIDWPELWRLYIIWIHFENLFPELIVIPCSTRCSYMPLFPWRLWLHVWEWGRWLGHVFDESNSNAWRFRCCITTQTLNIFFFFLLSIHRWQLQNYTKGFWAYRRLGSYMTCRWFGKLVTRRHGHFVFGFVDCSVLP